MHPILFQLGGYSQSTYGFMAALGLLLAFFLIDRLARRQGLDPDHMWNLAGLAIISGMVGSKLLLIVNEWKYYGSHLSEIFTADTLLRAAGVFSGGFVLATLTCWAYMRYVKIPFFRGADVMAPAIALGHAFGRIGCFSAGCCYGRPTEVAWGVTFTNPLAAERVGTPLGVRLHPTQLYEMTAEFANFALLMWLIGRKKRDGAVLGAYLALYGVERFIIEIYRGDLGRGELFGGALSATQAISIALVAAGALILVLRGRSSQTTSENV